MWPHGRKIVTVKQPIELLAIQCQNITWQVARPLEALFLQSLLPQAKAGPLPIERLDLVARLVDEDEQVARKRIMRQLLLDHNRQTVDAFAKVNRITRKPNILDIV